MKFGAWIHSRSKPSLTEAILQASNAGLESIRSYTIEYSREVAPTLKQTGLSLLAGMHIDAVELVNDWRSQVHLDELAAYFELGINLEAICVGNELREGGDAFDQKKFTGALAEGMAHVLGEYHDWMAKHDVSVPLTYANEMITFNEDGSVRPETLPLFDACDIIGINHYPMDPEGWQFVEAFKINKRLLCDPQTQDTLLGLFEKKLDTVMKAAQDFDKPVIFTETAFPSAVDWKIEGEVAPGKPRYVGVHDREAYQKTMRRFLKIIDVANQSFDERIKALYFYEWQDNHYHNKIWNIEQSPIHVAFGLTDHEGTPKLDISGVLQEIHHQTK
jgi:hypothetical protein